MTTSQTSTPGISNSIPTNHNLQAPQNSAALGQLPVTYNTNLIQKMLLQKSRTHSQKSHSHNSYTAKGKAKKKRIVKIRKPRIQFVSESLCPFCKKYSNEALSVLLSYPDYNKLVNFQFIFWGNAKATFNQSLKKYEFECQHGQEEVYGNSMLTCANRLFPNKVAVQYIYCMYGSLESFEKDFDKTNEYCLQGNTEVIAKIKECMDSKQGNIWFYEDVMASPDNTYVPYLIFDGQHDRDKQGQFKDDPFDFLCGMRYNQIKNKDICSKLTGERN